MIFTMHFLQSALQTKGGKKYTSARTHVGVVDEEEGYRKYSADTSRPFVQGRRFSTKIKGKLFIQKESNVQIKKLEVKKYVWYCRIYWNRTGSTCAFAGA